MTKPRVKARWLNSTVLGIGLASLFSGMSHEMATTAMPGVPSNTGVAAAWLRAADGQVPRLAAKFTKLSLSRHNAVTIAF
jgi:hypothetical protein